MSGQAPISPNDVARMVMLTYGRMQDGTGSYWCYVAVKPSEYDRLMSIMKAGQLDLTSFNEDGFGEILVSGLGLYPPPEVTKQIARTFNAPLKDIFSGEDPKSLIARKIEELKKNSENKD